MNYFTKYLADARIEDLRRDASRAQAHSIGPRRREREVIDNPITLRRARAGVAARLKRLASVGLVGASHRPVMLAELGGELRAARSLADGAILADPFRDTGALAELPNTWAAGETRKQAHA